MHEKIIQITGLTERQRQLAAALWQINALDKVDEFIEGLPNPWERQDAVTVKHMILAATLDVYTEDVTAARQELRRIGVMK